MKDLVLEIAKRDKVITQLLMSKVGRHMQGRGYYMQGVDVAEIVNNVNFEVFDLDEVIQHRIDQEVTSAFEEVENLNLNPIEKADMLTRITLDLLSHKKFVNMKAQLKGAVDKRRIELLKDV